ncbi:pectate lyase [Cellulomonas fimi]|uniref:pectate lyase n=1 Tax=Cellulomonas fimi (strain ATCC 484 / DSM 20113 / JCM 1341 / CCUG 24087 / LMG 16345 / NBRC 15513 / NCIMB 8980 / NCTC 7547 / NRS-133) TaxID=590998 RepID=F4H4Z5_CELFA|nr:pectate lyase [Cellulomonas fimi]AEE45475.1 Pectate lyase [Cellulomonas fimi ATCC 484]NNH07299.1 pectate lyase [Cellulomonas fimi]VEH29528.1 Pectate lyase A precursor [Cellulomonas fimi]
MTSRPTTRRARQVVALAVTGVLAAATAIAVAPAASAATPDGGASYVLVSRKSGKVVDVKGASTSDGAAAVTATRTDAASQQWSFVSVGSGWYELHNRASGKVLGVASASTSDGAALVQQTDQSSTAQQFSIAAQSDYVRLVNRGSGKAVSIAGASTSAGAAVVQLTDGKSYHQQWELVKVGATGTPAPTTSSTPRPTTSATPKPTTQPTSTPGSFPAWPTAKGEKKVSSTITVTGTLDGGMVRHYGISAGGQSESQPPMFKLENGAVLKNVILGTGAGDGVHCTGTCTLENVWWEDVEEDAATFKGTASSQVMTVNGGGARSASDKVFQHNGPGTFVITNFQVSSFGKLYRSCGNCSKQYARTVVVDNVQVTAPGKSLVGINPNLGDKATITDVTIIGDSSKKISICDAYKGVTSGEPSKTGSGPSAACGYSTSSITYK